MKAFLSFTDTFLRWFEGKISRDDLVKAVFFFGCGEIHVLRDDGLVPMEASWANDSKVLPHCYTDDCEDIWLIHHDGREVNPARIPPERLEKRVLASWKDFESIMREREKAGAIHWEFHHMFDFKVELHAAGYEVMGEDPEHLDDLIKRAQDGDGCYQHRMCIASILKKEGGVFVYTDFHKEHEITRIEADHMLDAHIKFHKQTKRDPKSSYIGCTKLEETACSPSQ